LGYVAKEEGRDAVAVDFYQRAYKADPLNEEAAVAYRNLLTQLQIVGQKPPEYLYLSDDEHDYLVQLFYQGKQIKQNTRDYLKRLAGLPGYAGQVDFSLKGIEAVQSFQPFLGSLYNTELSGYQRLQRMNVPGRFADMHYRVSLISLGHLQIFSEALKQFPTLAEDSTNAKAYQALLTDINQSDHALGLEMAAVASRLPEPVFKGLLSEAQLDDLPELNREIAQFGSLAASKKDQPKPAKLTGAAKSATQLGKALSVPQGSSVAKP